MIFGRNEHAPRRLRQQRHGLNNLKRGNVCEQHTLKYVTLSLSLSLSLSSEKKRKEIRKKMWNIFKFTLLVCLASAYSRPIRITFAVGNAGYSKNNRRATNTYSIPEKNPWTRIGWLPIGEREHPAISSRNVERRAQLPTRGRNRINQTGGIYAFWE